MTKTMERLSLPTIRCYGDYASGNYGAHCLRVTVGPITVWYSYTTPIAFHVGQNERVVRVNDWQQTTGKHLNAIDGGNKKSRVSGEEFERLWNEQVAPLLS
jgi:hypothetical protein